MVKRSPAVGLLFFPLLLTVLLAPQYFATAEPFPRKVLLLTSYHQGDRWNDSMVQGVRETLGSLESVNLSIENLDLRRYTDPENTRAIKEYLRAKYLGNPQDLVLVSDDPALNFFLAVRENLFPNAQVVFCGINNFNPKLIQGQSNITGVNETLSLQATLELALRLFPQTTRIMAVVSDTEINGRVNLEHFRTVATQMKERVQFGELLNMTGKDAPDILSRLPKNSLVLRLINLIRPEGGYLSLQDSIRILSAHAPVPIFTPWSFDLGDGALGGYVSSGADQGRTAGNLAIRILQGQRADQIPVVMDSPNVPMFDYKVMERFGIKESDLPKGSVVLNHQLSAWEQYWGWLLGFLVIAVLQTFLIVTLLTRGKRLRAANVALQDSEHFSRSLLEAIPVPVFYKGRDGRYQGFNQAFLHFYGKNKDELIGKSVFDITPLDIAKVYHAKDMELFEKSGIQVYPYEVKTAQGDLRDVIFHKASLTDEHGVVTGLIGAILDVTDLKRMERRNQVLADIIKRSQDFIGVADVKQMAFFVNPAGQALVGLDGDEAVAKTTIEEYFLTEDLPFVQNTILPAVMKEGRWAGEFRFRHFKTGKPVPVLYDLFLAEDPKTGAATNFATITRDITEHKQAEIALRQSEEKFRQMTENVREVFWLGSLDWNEIYYVSPAYTAIWGKDVNELYTNPHSWLDQVIAEDKEKVRNAILAQTPTSTSQIVFPDYRVRRADGSLVWISAKAFPVIDSHGLPYRIAGIAEDITERKRSEETLRASEEKFRKSLEFLPVPIAVARNSGDLLFLNKQFLETYGYTLEEIPTMGKWLELVYPDIEYRNSLYQSWSNSIEVAIRHNIPTAATECFVTCKNGDIRIVEISAFVGTDYSIGLFQDITERKRAEEEKRMLTDQLQQAQKMEAIGTLAGGIAHDFNNMLGAILGYAEIIRDDFPPGSPGIHDIDQILKASHRAKDLVKQILTFSRQMEGQKSPMNPAVIVKEAINLLRSSLPTTITINQDIAADVGMVLADPIQIHQIVMNLCTNAFHAMEVKGGTLTISLRNKLLSQDDLATEPDLQPGTFVQLSIKDTGEGILPEIREKIFDPFFTTKEVGKGTGLGLSMVYSIVKSSGGSIACDSRMGEGTEFRIILPVLEGHAVQENRSEERIPHGKEHILLVDDDEILVELSQTMLERLGYHVTTRRSSLDALTTFQNQPDAFDLVITDQTMPGMTGVDLARRILQLRPEMPIILCTGYSSLITEDKAKAAGIQGFAFKPLAKKDIAALIRKVLDGK